jgi:hypothetical protein
MRPLRTIEKLMAVGAFSAALTGIGLGILVLAQDSIAKAGIAILTVPFNLLNLFSLANNFSIVVQLH